MATLLTMSMVTRKALALFRNSSAFIQTISKTYDDSFAKTGAKIGSSLKVRLPNDPLVRTGATASPQSITEQATTIVLATQKGVDLTFGSAELALSMDDFGERVLMPSMNNLAGAISADIIGGIAPQIPNLVHNVDGSNNTISPTATTWLAAGAALDSISAPRGNRKAVLHPATSAKTVASLLGLFNPAPAISELYRSGWMGATSGTLGIDDWRMDQTVISHTVAAYGTLPTVASGGVTAVNPATGCTVAVSTTTAPINAGDILTFAGVHSVNRVTGVSTGVLAQFVVTAAAATGSTSIQVYPAMIAPVSGVKQSFQTVDALPATGAAIASPTNASETYRQNMVFVPDALQLVSADLELPSGAVVDAGRAQWDGISMRVIRDFVTTTDQFLTRFDVLYGYAVLRPEWCVIVADSIP